MIPDIAHALALRSFAETYILKLVRRFLDRGEVGV